MKTPWFSVRLYDYDSRQISLANLLIYSQELHAYLCKMISVFKLLFQNVLLLAQLLYADFHAQRPCYVR